MFTPRSSQPKTTPAPPLKQTQTSLSNAFSKAPPTSRPPPPSHGPSLNTVLQKTAATNIVRPKPRERIIKAFECSSSFAENGPATRNNSSSSSVAAAGNRSPEIKSQLSALHDAVFFDEGDFDDDSDLNFDDSVVVEDTCTRPASPGSFRVPTPPLPRNMLPAGVKRRSPTPVKRDHGCIDGKDIVGVDSPQETPPPPYSSAPFPWSSSPVEHFIPPPRPVARIPPRPERQQVQKKQREKQPPSRQPEFIDLMDDEPEEVPKKKRKIPWAKDGAAPSTVPLSRTVKATAPRKPEWAKAPGGLPKLPWEMTATDVKRASRRDAEQRRGMSTMAAKGGKVEQKEELKQGKLTLSTEQMHVLDLVLDSGKSVFFTGSAGTGKSVLMREVIAALRSKYTKDSDSASVAVTASTGLAACNVGGVTLHSFAGIGLGKECVPDLVKKIKRNPKAKKRWLQTKVLVIDEISMVDGELFDKLEGVARTIRNNGRPFGGIQLVVTGDFFQLPPVPDYGKVAKFAFDANTWNTTIEHTIGLTQVFRQRDPEFAAILNEMRLGKLSRASVAVFQGLSRPLIYADGIQPTELFPTRQEVDAANNSKMRLLSGAEKIFKSTDGGTIADSEHRTKLLSNCMAPQVITLKESSQVMLIKNIDDTLVNGSLGRVVGFMSEKTFDLVHDDDDDVGSHETTSTTKSSINPKGPADTADKWPLVEFALPDGTCRQLLVQPETWKVELPSGEVQASRTQIPLILAWALSIHKAQGQTLERVKVDLGKVFEKGQAYVALSRATCQEGLEVLRFDATKVMAHEKVREFYKSLYSAAEAKAKRVETRKRTEESEAKLKKVEARKGIVEEEELDNNHGEEPMVMAGYL